MTVEVAPAAHHRPKLGTKPCFFKYILFVSVSKSFAYSIDVEWEQREHSDYYIVCDSISV